MPALKRLMLTEEKLVAMGIPVDHVDIGANTDNELCAMVGNTMHTRCVAVAMMVLLSLLDRSVFARELADMACEVQKRARRVRPKSYVFLSSTSVMWSCVAVEPAGWFQVE